MPMPSGTLYRVESSSRLVPSRDGKVAGKTACLATLLAALLLFAPAQLWSQLVSASISGTVRDASGAVTPGVQITVRNVETGIPRVLQTDSSGHYLVSNIPPGSYEVQAELTGFQTEVRRGITLTLGREAVVDVALTVGQVQEQVVVTGEAPLVETSNAALAGLVDQQQVAELPLNGRSLTQLTTLQPGVLYLRGSASSSTGQGENLSINGARQRQINFLLNGTSIMNFHGKSPSGVSGRQLGVEAVREFTVLTNSYSAEFGKSAGGVVNAVTKSGTNAFHGSLFEYLRNSKLDARGFFDRDPSNPTKRSDPPAFKRNQFGGSLGGPLRKDQTFFFTTVEFLRDRLGQTSSPSFPTALARQGILLSRPAFSVASSIKPYLDLLPIPTGVDLNDGTARHQMVSTQTTDQEYVNARMDHNLSASDSLFGSYVYDNSGQFTPGVVPDLFFTISPFRSQYVTVEETRIFTPSLLNIAHFGFNRSKTNDGPTCDESISKLSFIPSGKCFRTSVSGMSAPGAGLGPRIFILNSFQYSDTVSWMHGAHSAKFGGYFERTRVNGEQESSPDGIYDFTSVENFLRANPRFFEATSPGLNLWRGMRQNLFAFFANDSWRLPSKFTVNLGLRYEFVTSPTEVNGMLSNIPCLTCNYKVGEPYFEKNPSLRNFSPRVGIAWSPGASQNTSVRAGFGIFYDQLTLSLISSGPFRSPPFWEASRMTASSTFTVPFPDAYAQFLTGQSTPQPSFLFSQEGAPAQPYNIQYNLSVQRQLPWQTVVMMAYVGTQGRHLARVVDNQAVPIIQPDRRYFFPTTSVRRNSRFAEVRFKAFETNSSYNSLQLAVRRRFAQGMGLQVSYTWSKSLDMLSDAQGTGDLNNDTIFATLPESAPFDRGRAAFDARHNLSANFTLDVPFGKNLEEPLAKLLAGWQTQGIVTLQSGLPTAVLLGFDNARTRSTRVQQRPNLNPGVTAESVVLGAPNRTKDPDGRYLNPDAFSLADPGYLGNLGRGVFSGPGLATFDFSLIKNTAIRESVNLEFRSEFFNLFNRPNFSPPDQTVFNQAGQTKALGSFATINNTQTTSRQIQFALKLTF